MKYNKDALLVASDLDGTLLNDDKRIPLKSAQLLRELRKAGKQIILATGRHYIDALTIAKFAQLKPHFIAANGAQVYTDKGKCLRESYLPSRSVELVVGFVKQNANINVNLYHKDAWYVARETDWLLKYKHQINIEHYVMDIDNPPSQHILKIYFTSTDRSGAALIQLEKQLVQRFAEDIHVCFSSPQCLEVMAKGVSKLAGIELLANELGGDVNNCIAFGDGMNDIEMLTGVGHPVLMGNACQRVKRALPNVPQIGRCNDEAVASYLEQRFTSKKCEVTYE